jgi:hypothetical protein
MGKHIGADGFEQKKSANQLYRESGSSLPFKVWLQTQQSEGLLLNAEGAGGGGGAATSSATASDNTPANAPKKKASLDEIFGYIGKAAEGAEKIVGLGTGIADTVKKAKADKAAAAQDANLNNIPSNIGGGGNDKKQPLGIPPVIQYSVVGIGVVLVGYFIYKNFIASGDGVATPVLAATK